jgi:hypothetical protein
LGFLLGDFFTNSSGHPAPKPKKWNAEKHHLWQCRLAEEEVADEEEEKTCKNIHPSVEKNCSV